MGALLAASRSPVRALASAAAALLLVACSTPMSPSSPAPAAPVAGAVLDRRLDVLDYVVGEAGLWPRRGSHGQNQIVDLGRREVCWTKYGNPRRFECWRWNDDFVYHAVDHALDGDSNESYV